MKRSKRMMMMGRMPSGIAPSALYRWSSATVNGGSFVTAVADAMGGASLSNISASDTERPTLRVTGTSGHTVGVFSATSGMKATLDNERTSPSPIAAMGLWLKPTSVALTQTIATTNTNSGGASAARFTWALAGDDPQVTINLDASNTRQGRDLTGGVVAGQWQFHAFNFVGGAASEATQLQLFRAGSLLAGLTFTNPTGSGAMPTTLVQPTGFMWLGCTNGAGAGNFVADVGDIHFFKVAPTASQWLAFAQACMPVD